MIAKGKNQDIEKWEAELRKNIAAKKAAGTPALSKQDRVLVDAQLRLESQTRQRVQNLSLGAKRGFGLVQSIVNARVPQLENYISKIVSLLLEGALRLGTPLVGSEALDAYTVCGVICFRKPFLLTITPQSQGLTSIISERLRIITFALTTATLRLLEIDILPESHNEEPLAGALSFLE